MSVSLDERAQHGKTIELRTLAREVSHGPSPQRSEDGFSDVHTLRNRETADLGGTEGQARHGQQKRRWFHLGHGWHGTQTSACVYAMVTFVTVLGVYAGLFASYQVTHGSATLFESSCTTVTIASTLVHLALNMMSTLLLGASNFTMQGLCAPTREEIDRAHSQRQWLDIATPSLRNLRFVSVVRTLLWLTLGLSTLLIHISFNSVFFTSAQTNQYAVAQASQRFLDQGTTNLTCSSTDPDQFRYDDYVSSPLVSFVNHTGCPVRDILFKAATNASSLTRLSPRDCIDRYGDQIVTGSSSVVLLGEHVGDDGLMWARRPTRYLAAGETNTYVNAWVCQYNLNYRWVPQCSTRRALHMLSFGDWILHARRIEACLVQPIQNTCKLRFNVWFMLFVVTSTFLTTLTILLSFILYRRKKFLRTVGDAVSSFLEHPDPSSKDMCLAGEADFRTYTATAIKPGPLQAHGKRLRWYQSFPALRWYGTNGLNVAFIALLAVALYFAYDGAHGTAFENSLGAANLQSVEPITNSDQGSSNFVPTSLVANLPQLVYTIIHLYTNKLLSDMLVGREWVRHASERKGLRVSEKPRGAQRETYFLALPYRYALPQMIYSAAVHWLLSQSLFFVEIESLDVSGITVPSDTIARLGYSVIGVITSIVALFIGQCALIWLGFRRLDRAAIPHHGNNSLLIAAACHPSKDATDAHLDKVQWGEVSGGQGSEPGEPAPSQDESIGHCTFSGQIVQPPREQYWYR